MFVYSLTHSDEKLNRFKKKKLFEYCIKKILNIKFRIDY